MYIYYMCETSILYLKDYKKSYSFSYMSIFSKWQAK